MVYITFIYLLLLFVYLLKQTDRASLAIAILSIYLFSVFCGILIDVFDLYGSYGISDEVTSIPATIVFCLGITAVVYPFTKIKSNQITTITLQKPILLDVLTLIFIVAASVFYLTFDVSIFLNVITDAQEVKSEHYAALSYLSTDTTQVWYMYIVNICLGMWSIMLGIWFYRIIFIPKSVVLNLLLLIASLGGVVKSLEIAGRAAIVYWLLTFMCYIVFFYPLMSPAIKKRMFLTCLSFGGMVVILLVVITISRFAEYDDNGSIMSLIGYAGQMYNNFCALFEARHNIPLNFNRIFPLISKYVYGVHFDLLAFYDQIYFISGVFVNRFTTIIGGLIINIGFIGMLIYMLLYNIIFTITFKEFKKETKFCDLILFFFFILAPIKGLFGLPFNQVSDTLLFISTTVLYILFRYTFKFK